MSIKAKFFQGEDENSCRALAEMHFGKKSSELYIQMVREKSEREPALFFAADPGGNPSAVSDMDGAFALYYEAAGVFLEIYPGRGSGAHISREEIMDYIGRKALNKINAREVGELLKAGFGRVGLAPAQEERVLDEEAQVLVPAKEDMAFLKLLPPDPGGTPLKKDGVLKALAAAGVVYGIDESAIDDALFLKSYNQKRLVASGTEPQHGENGRLIFHFERERDGKPRIQDDGKVDYRKLDLFESVTEGQLLITRVPPTPGLPGFSVRGKEIKPTPGRDLPLPKGKNITINEDKTELYAACSGMVEFSRGSVNVLNVYTVKGDADLNVGNIDFDGSVVITGNVISNLTIKATGNIEVGGVVEAATLTAGGNILLKRGIQGMDKGRVYAKGSVTAGYIERSYISAGENITANIIAHSNIEAGSSLILSGKMGSVVGGSIKVAKELRANILGSVSDTPTDIEVGILPQKRTRQKLLQTEVAGLQKELEKLGAIAGYLDRLPDDNPKKMEASGSVIESIDRIAQLLGEYSEELNRLNFEFENAACGKVHVKDTAYPGVRITIATAAYRVTQPTQHCTFKIQGSEVVFSTYEG